MAWYATNTAATARPVLVETVSPSRIAGTDEAMKPITGTKSQTPAITARSSAAGTFSNDIDTPTTTAAKMDVITLPATYAKMTRSHSTSVWFNFGRYATGTKATSQSRVAWPSIRK